MTNDIDNLLHELNSEDQPAARPTSQRRLMIATGLVAAATVLLSAGIAFSGVLTPVDPQPAAAAEEADWPGITTDSTTPAPPEVSASAAPTVVAAGADMPVYNADTDISTIPLPTDETDHGLQNAKVWLTQQGIIADCMRDQGFEYTFTPYYLYPEGYFPKGSSVTPGTPAWVALDGEPDRPLGDDYDWRTAGCTGYAVHVTGMDDAN